MKMYKCNADGREVPVASPCSATVNPSFTIYGFKKKHAVNQPGSVHP